MQQYVILPVHHDGMHATARSSAATQLVTAHEAERGPAGIPGSDSRH